MKVLSEELQKTFMESVINIAGSIGINCSITTDAGTHSFDVNTGKVTKSYKDQPEISGQLQFDLSGMIQDINLNEKRPVEMLTFEDLYRRLTRSAWDDASSVYIGDDATEKYNPRFNNWYVNINELDHQTSEVILYAKPNYDPSKTIFRCSILLNHLMRKCTISYAPAPNNFPVNHCDHEVDLKTKIVDTDEWGMKFCDKLMMMRLRDKLISLAED